MKYTIVRNTSRGSGNANWLQSAFSFSFANYYDPGRMAFGKLRVVNDDVIAPGKGFGMHPHKDMEIITLVQSGSLAHEDSTGGSGVIGALEVQVMSAGSGVFHSEFNASDREQVHLFQLWIDTKEKGIAPRYDQKSFDLHGSKGSLVVVASGDTKDVGALYIHQNAKVLQGEFSSGDSFSYHVEKGRGIFVMLVSGGLSVLGEKLDSRDSIEIVGEGKKVDFLVSEDSRLFLIDVPMN